MVGTAIDNKLSVLGFLPIKENLSIPHIPRHLPVRGPMP